MSRASIEWIEQHRLVYEALEDEMQGPIHALSLETQTPDD